MKKLNILYLIMAITVISSSCKKALELDRDVETLTEDKVFADSALIFNFLTNIYAKTGQDVALFRSSYMRGTSPDGIDELLNLENYTTMSVSFYSAPQAGMMIGSLSAATHPLSLNHYWDTYYNRIRAATLLMQKLPATPLSEAMKSRLMGEARYLRAFYYAALVRYFGGVQLMGDAVLETDDILVSKRNTYKECIDYIASEMDEAAKLLPSITEQESKDLGRATSGAALAIKARMLLTAASPLFNGKPLSSDGSLLPYICYSSTYDAALWQKAADAMKAVIDLGQYSLVVDNITRPGHGFWKQFVKERTSSELIMPFMQPINNYLEYYHFPTSRSNGYGGYSNPTENAVQRFGMKNGKLIGDANSGYDAANPYLNRDPRFYYTIIYNQAPIWRSGSGTTMVPVDIYFNAATNSLTTDGLQSYHTKTGYYTRKMCNDSVGYSASVYRSLPVIRYAEIIMGYAECLNELGRTEEAVTYLNQIRERAGITAGIDNRYGIPAGISQEELRKLIQNEYLVEFFDEGHYYYDCRRWRTAEITENSTMQGNYITKQTDGTFTYKLVTVLPVLWNNRAYLAPIPQAEINKAATLIQNPGW